MDTSHVFGHRNASQRYLCDMHPAYKAVIGLEVHAQLSTRSKIFCADPVTYGTDPNTSVSPVSLGHPGTLPTLNQTCIEYAIRIGLATHCTITRENQFARKNYFYADLPKGYQVSQDTTPICRNGFIDITLKDGTTKRVRIHRIHMEEDSGKSIHDQDPFDSLVDLNRAGTGLIEIVTEPDITSPEEASAYIAEIRKLVRYLDICDGNMEEGSLRCDANISVMKHTDTRFGTKVEVKNMNSITNVGKAIAYEIERQIAALEVGEKVVQQTRTWDAVNQRTLVMRDKESSDDYRYFPEPDLLPVIVTETWLEEIRATLPELPQELFQRYTRQLGLSVQDAITLIEQKEVSQMYNRLYAHSGDAKAAAVWILGPVKSWMNEMALPLSSFPLDENTLTGIIRLVANNKVSFTAAKDLLFPALLNQPEADPETLAGRMDLIMVSDVSGIESAMQALMDANPGQVEAYRGGKTGLMGWFVGQIMKQMQGKGNPKEVSAVVQRMLEQP